MLKVLIIGAGPAGLIAADYLSSLSYQVTIADQMPSPARKLLMAGRGGLNLTHSEPLSDFLIRYREASGFLAPFIQAFTPDDLRSWCKALGQDTFVGSSGRVFPAVMKASPLLRALLNRLNEQNVSINLRTAWTGFSEDGSAIFDTPDGQGHKIEADAVLLALGGASWPRLGSDGSWVSLLKDKGIAVSSLRPANCGFRINWSGLMAERFAGTPLKRLCMSVGDQRIMGEAVISSTGLEGGLVYALSADLRSRIEAEGQAELSLDLRPGLSAGQLTRKLSAPRRKQSISTFLRKAAGLSPAEAALLREAGPLPGTAEDLALRIKDVRLTTQSTYDMERAISSAGGICLDQLDDRLMLKAMPGVFAAGEMLDWEAPTGGYLLQACFSTGLAAAKGIDRHLSARRALS